MPEILSAHDAIALVHRRAGPGGRVHVPGCSGEPLIFADAYREAPEMAAGLVYSGIWIPGVNATDWASLTPSTHAETIFLSPVYRSSYKAGRVAFRPLAYTQAWRALEAERCDAAFFHVSPPDKDGNCSLGVSGDFSPAVVKQAKYTIAHVNAAMPVPVDAPSLPYASFHGVVVEERPLLTVEAPTLDPAFASIAHHIAGMIPEDATLQFGLGKVQLAILHELTSAKGLRIHSGMVSDPILPLLGGEALADGRGAITVGVAMGSPALYEAIARDERVRFAPVGFTHDIRTLAAIPRFIAINSIIEIDLFGQANAEFIQGEQISGTGGLVDFLRGARVSEGGLPIVALVSTAKKGSVSRIVPRLSRDAVSIARADIGIVVTEHGAVDLRTLDVDGRARALISIADPAHRDDLARQWAQMRSRL